MKNIVMTMIMATILTTACGESSTEQSWIVDRFGDVKILRYEVPGFEELPLDEKLLIYHLSQSAKWGRDILFDQNFKHNLTIRKSLEAAYQNYQGDKSTAEWLAFETYLKRVWFANGIHHHYSKDKFTPAFSEEFFVELINSTPQSTLPMEREALLALISPIIFDPTLYASALNTSGEDKVHSSANNYYEGLTQAEVEEFYGKLFDPSDATPISHGLNSKLIKDEDGNIYEQVWHIGGGYSAALEQIVNNLEVAAEYAKEPQRSNIKTLIEFYQSGDLARFDKFNIAWVQDSLSTVDFVNGFTETYGDPMGIKASWESVVNFKNMEASERTDIISQNAQWFEDHSPINPLFRKDEVKGVSAKVITVAMLAGDCYPATPIGINLPNADWIRRDYGSKSVTIDNITYAYDKAAQGSGFNEEFVLRADDRERLRLYGKLSDDLHTDMHECLGHGSGQLAKGVTGTELKSYSAPLEEARADLFALYYMADPKMIELGLLPNADAVKAQYTKYILNGMMTQLTRIELGKSVEQAHMRNRKLISEWCYNRGLSDNVIEWVEQDGKRYVVVNDFDKLRTLFGELLYEVQRIKSEGDFEAGRDLIENYAVKIDESLHAEVLERYSSLGIEPYSGFVNPEYELVMDGDKVVDVKISYPSNYVEQMLEYSNNYSAL